MNAVGIDVSKGKSTVTVLRPFGEIIISPFDVHHTVNEVNDLIQLIKKLDGESRIVMEHTGRYYEPIACSLAKAGCYVCAVNPKLIKDFGNNTLRKVKTDKADALKIARYTLDNWNSLKEYEVMDDIRKQLKTINRQYSFYTKQNTSYKNNLISLLDLTYPGSNRYFDSPARKDGHEKWVDFASTYWHAEVVKQMSKAKFIDHYQRWCKRNKYNFNIKKAEEIYSDSKELLSSTIKNEAIKGLVKGAANQLFESTKMVESLRETMDNIASTLPECPVVMSMTGVGHSLGPQLMAELGDIKRFTHRTAITAFAGVDPGANQSGSKEQKSVRTTKKGSAHLRRTLYLVVRSLLLQQAEGDPVYDFMVRKLDEGKPFYVCMTAGENKFLRVYYGKVKKYLNDLDKE